MLLAGLLRVFVEPVHHVAAVAGNIERGPR
jgi:hypothetical protein